MARIYKIHPGIGIMRLGDSQDAFFVGPEKSGHPGLEIDGNGTETTIQQYKANGRIKKQAARFRIWEYDEAANGTLTPLREITSAQATITWKVTLVNSKAAGRRIVSQIIGDAQVMVPEGTLRNASITDRESLTIRGGTHEISGASQPPKQFDQGRFLGKQVPLGQIRTDGSGRLLVLGGKGDSEGIPAVAGQPVPLSDWANNNRWHDDVSDGPVTATVSFDGQSAIQAVPSWVICAPPDFAPGIGGIVSLYEIALQAAIDRGWRTPSIPVSFRRDIFPVIQRAGGLRWTHDWNHWNRISRDWARLSDKTNPQNRDLRVAAFQQIDSNTFHEFMMPGYLQTALSAWANDDFNDDWALGDPVLTEPELLDRAALEACIGANFFPGIEAGFRLTNPQWYTEPFRLSHQQIIAGQVTGGMALPWQADFNDCADDWWPSQRPNSVYKTVTAVTNNEDVDWARGVYSGGSAASREKLRANVTRLGFIVPTQQNNETLYLESERDASLPET